MLVACRSLPHTAAGGEMRLPLRLPSAAHAIYRATFAERISRAYMCLVAAALALVLIDTAFITHQDALYGGLWLVLITLPWTPMLWSLFDAIGGAGTPGTVYGWGGWVMAVIASLVSALVNAGLLALAARFWRRSPRPRAEMPESPHGDR
jgi:hypothetical protein